MPRMLAAVRSQWHSTELVFRRPGDEQDRRYSYSGPTSGRLARRANRPRDRRQWRREVKEETQNAPSTE